LKRFFDYKGKNFENFTLLNNFAEGKIAAKQHLTG